MLKKIILLSAFTLLVQVTFAQKENRTDARWTPLFNSKDLKGWKQLNGQAKYTVENGEIVGTTVANTTNSFLCTEQDYGDFILELDLKVAEGMNSP